MIPRIRLVVFSLLFITTAVVCASAQDSDPDETTGRFRLGPLRFTPSIALTNLGVDDNVFNDDTDPKSDTTGGLGPAVNLWMRVGRSRLNGQVSGQYVYFREYENQRSWSTTDQLKWEFPLGRVTPFIAGSYANTRTRPGFEIDSRAHQIAQAVTVGTTVTLSGVTSLMLAGARSSVRFDENETFAGADLAQALNGTQQTESLQLRLRLTPLTTFVVGADALQDRLDEASIRNANSIRVMPGFELKPAALISGRVLVGFRRFDALSSRVPDYQGVIADVGATYIAGATKFVLRVSRDLNFSFEETDPYYALTDLGLTITQRMGRGWDVMARGGRQTLAYRQLAAPVLAPERRPRTDVVRQYGGGFGYRVGRIMRIGLDAIYYRRNSTQVADRDFTGFRYGLSISYGMPQ